jgi:putative transport protein
MNWLFQLNASNPIAHAIGLIALVCFAGMALGSFKVCGVGLGGAGVLFAGIITGHFGKSVDKDTLAFVRDFGLILFVFTIGLQLGPGFFATLRQQGVKWNALAAVIVILGAVTAPLIGCLAGFNPAAVLGIFSGASVNMPSLGASTLTLSTLPNIPPDTLALPALACAVAFPTAIVGSIATLLLLKKIFRIDLAREAADFVAKNRRQVEPLERRTLIVANSNLAGITIDAIPSRVETGVTVSRHRRAGETEVHVAVGKTVLQLGDAITAVGTRAMLDQFQRVVGQRSDEDLQLAPGNVTYRRVVVTNKAVLGKTLGELALGERYGTVVSRVSRSDIELTAAPTLRLQFGDMLQVVGEETSLEQSAKLLGNSVRELNETHFIPFFIGIFLGIVIGMEPLAFPGLPQPVRLGLAGGPLIVALVLGRIGRIGRLVWHMPVNANLAFREFGVALFFAAVGLDAGPKFFAIVFSAIGVQWMLAGACVTILPLLFVCIFARAVWRMNFIDLTGLLAGSTTNPPALAFATNMAGSDAPTMAYAQVYPLTMVLRILCAQILALVLFR